jgi:adenylosuccinate synthase
MTKNFVDVVLDLQMGDSAKGKITHHLASGRSGKKYTHVLRGNGGGNAGHSIYHHGKKFITHIIPAGVFHNITSIIGPGCVINVEGLIKEINTLKAGGVDVAPYLRIANNAHIVTEEHLLEERGEMAVGTTRQGNGPAYRDKYARKGVRAETALRGTPLQDLLIDMQQEFYGDSHNPSRVLYEGAQGFYLDIDWGDYPYVTSSHCGIGGVLLNGFNHKQIDTVYGAIKCYETYVGAKQFEDASNPVFAKIREIGEEYGSTTKRPRQVNWINLDRLDTAVTMNGVDTLVISKMDVLRKVDVWNTIVDGNLVQHQTEAKFKTFIESRFRGQTIYWSDSPERI